MKKEQVRGKRGKSHQIRKRRFAGKIFKRKQGVFAVNVGKRRKEDPDYIEYNEELQVICIILIWDALIKENPGYCKTKVQGDNV